MARRRVLMGSVIVAALVVSGAVALIIWRAGDPGPASVEDALERFDGDDGDDHGADEEIQRPPEGVYEYAGEGSERISFPPVSQQDGAIVPGTVTHGADGCWEFRLDYNAAHWQDWLYCPSDGRIAEAGGHTHQAWHFGVTTVTNLSTFECDPPAAMFPPEEPGWSVEQRCTGTNDSLEGTTISAGRWRYVGPDSLDVDGEAVDVWHFRQERTISGAQDGEQTAEMWFREDGLLLRSERDVEVTSPSPIGDVTYTETGSVELISLEPQR